MTTDLVAVTSTTIDAPLPKVWQALVDPEMIRQYMFDATVETDWKKGSPITWRGEWKGKAYEDKGVILEIVPERTLRYTHFSPLSGLPDVPSNYHVVAVELETQPDGRGVRVGLVQDGNPTEEAREHSQQNWSAMLASLKKLLEG